MHDRAQVTKKEKRKKGKKKETAERVAKQIKYRSNTPNTKVESL
jgi:hypothetical protein